MLKDFVLGSFNVCSVAASKTCVNDSQADDTVSTITYNIRGCAVNDASGEIHVTSLLNSIGGGAQYSPSDVAWYIPPAGFDPATQCSVATALASAVANGTRVPAADLDTTLLAAGEALVYHTPTARNDRRLRALFGFLLSEQHPRR